MRPPNREGSNRAGRFFREVAERQKELSSRDHHRQVDCDASIDDLEAIVPVFFHTDEWPREQHTQDYAPREPQSKIQTDRRKPRIQQVCNQGGYADEGRYEIAVDKK